MHLKSGFDFTRKDAYNTAWGKKLIYNSGGLPSEMWTTGSVSISFLGAKKSCID